MRIVGAAGSVLVVGAALLLTAGIMSYSGQRSDCARSCGLSSGYILLVAVLVSVPTLAVGVALAWLPRLTRHGRVAVLLGAPVGLLVLYFLPAILATIASAVLVSLSPFAFVAPYWQLITAGLFLWVVLGIGWRPWHGWRGTFLVPDDAAEPQAARPVIDLEFRVPARRSLRRRKVSRGDAQPAPTEE